MHFPHELKNDCLKSIRRASRLLASTMRIRFACNYKKMLDLLSRFCYNTKDPSSADCARVGDEDLEETMEKTTSKLRPFIERFAELSAGGTPELMAAQFGETFLAAGPHGAQCVRNEDFARMLPKRKEMFDRMGLKKTDLVAVEDTMLDTRYALVKTQWQFVFEPNGAEPASVLVHSSYLVDCAGEQCTIVLYLAHQDIMTVAKERGLLKQ